MSDNQQIELAKETTAVEKYVQTIRATQVQTQAQLTELNAELVAVKTRAKEIEALEKTVTTPLNASLKAARSVFAPAKQGYSSLEAALKAKVAEGHRYLEAEAQRALTEAARLFQSNDAVAAGAALASVPEAPEHKGSSVRTVWKWRVVDETQVPRELLTVDPVRVNGAVAAGARWLSGIEIYSEDLVTVRTR
jgi:chromosome segregation ATPase